MIVWFFFYFFFVSVYKKCVFFGTQRRSLDYNLQFNYIAMKIKTTSCPGIRAGRSYTLLLRNAADWPRDNAEVRAAATTAWAGLFEPRSCENGSKFCRMCLCLWVCEQSVVQSGFMRGSAGSRCPAGSTGLRVRQPEESRCLGARGGQDGSCRACWQVLEKGEWEAVWSSGGWGGSAKSGNMSAFIRQLRREDMKLGLL